MIFLLGFYVLYAALGIVHGECNEFPENIHDSTYNLTGPPPFAEGTVVIYKCDIGYIEISKDPTTACRNGTWDHLKFECILQSCEPVDVPRDASMVNYPTYELGSRVEFECHNGFRMIGPSVMICREGGQWSPSIPPSCERKICEEFGNIEHASIFQESPGVKNSFESKIYVRCDDGYNRKGGPYATCNANGKWDHRPECIYSSCGSHPYQNSSCIYESDIKGSLIGILCEKSDNDKVSVTETGNTVAFCNGKWDNLEMGCFCDCKMAEINNKTVIATNLNHFGFLKHNTELKWHCVNGFKKKSNDTIKCIDGKVAMPECTLDDKVDEVVTTEKPLVGVSTLAYGVLAVLVLLVINKVILLHSYYDRRKVAKKNNNSSNTRYQQVPLKEP